MKDVKKIFVRLYNTIEEAMATIERGGVGIALIVDRQSCLIGTITDGDIRRAILSKIPLKTKIEKLFKKSNIKRLKSVTASVGTPHEKLLHIMKERDVRHIPLLNNDRKVVELVWLSELIEEELPLPLTAVVMAGGRGMRLHPFTKNLPKPMLPLRRRPIMERTIRQLRQSGIKEVHIATNYKSEAILNHFGNGDKFDLNINYLNEDRPLGTAGALSLMGVPKGTTLVVNGDVLTQLNFRAMYDFHRSHKAIMTVGVRKCDFKVPYGVIETVDVHIRKLVEKPLQTFIVNAGIYLLEPLAHKYIPAGRYFDMTELVETLIKSKQRVISFPIQEYWLDVGRPLDYEQAKEDAKNGKV